MIVAVGTMAVFAVGGSLAYQSSRGADDDLLVPLPPASEAASARAGTTSGSMADAAGEGRADAASSLPSVSPPDARAAAATTPPAVTARETLIVYVTGAVKKPGIVTLHTGDRIFQAVHQAGGFKAGAVKDALNLADRLQDGDQIHVPARGDATAQQTQQTARRAAVSVASLAAPVRHAEAVPLLSSRGSSGPSTGRIGQVAPPRPARVLGRPPAAVAAPLTNSAAEVAPDDGAPKPARARGGGGDKLRNPGDGTVNINTAGSTELQRLVRCGPAMAERILAYRQQIGGRFSAPQQLMDVKGVGEKTFAKWEPFVTVK